MKSLIVFGLMFIGFTSLSQNSYNKYFTENSMRVDFVLTGNYEKELISLDKIKKEPFWGGSKKNLIDKFNYGEFKFEILDKKTGELIFSRGFCALFSEWQTTTEARNLNKSFYQTIQFPFPLNEVTLKIYSKNWEGQAEQIFELNIDPDDYFINQEQYSYEYIKKVDQGDPSEKVDIVFLAEGYTKDEMAKFEKDAERFISYLFSQAPYKKYISMFNIWLVKSESEESGVDIPGKNVYKKTAMNSNFYTLDSERYLTSMDVFKIRDIASVVPYDDICIIVNTDKYGGGGIYNHYAIFSAGNQLSKEVFIHEFGHSFAGLGDEYYTSSTSYNDFYNLKIEPWEPNITTLVDFDEKWKAMVEKETEIPTSRENKNKKTIGVFEGGGYVNKGMYSPYMNCRMKTNEAEGFCPVCQDAILKMILFKTE